MQIVYKDMPIDKAEVKALNKKGFKVVDARFKPADQVCPLSSVKAPIEKPAPRRKTK
jgi:hypothetical protein